MTWNPWWQNRLLSERLLSAEQSIQRQQRYLQIHYTTSIVMHRELSLAHAALRRKNLALKLLRTRLAQKKEQP